MKEPVDHIFRPRLPWRDPDATPITECGYDARKVSALTRDQFRQRLKDYGQQRTALTTCMTCSQTASRWGAWDDDPRHALQREIEWEVSRWGHGHEKRGRALLDELIAIAELIEAHRDEFVEIMAVNARKREWAERKDALVKRPKVAAGKGRL